MTPIKNIIPLDEFRQKLRDHKWSCLADNYAAFIRAERAEQLLFSMAMNGGMLHVNEYAYQKRRILQEHTQAGYTKGWKDARAIATERFSTGDAEFDAYRDRVLDHDWYYGYSDDGNVWRAGEARQTELTNIAKEKGGLYAIFWAYRCRRHTEQHNARQAEIAAKEVKA